MTVASFPSWISVSRESNSIFFKRLDGLHQQSAGEGGTWEKNEGRNPTIVQKTGAPLTAFPKENVLEVFVFTAMTITRPHFLGASRTNLQQQLLESFPGKSRR